VLNATVMKSRWILKLAAQARILGRLASDETGTLMVEYLEVTVLVVILAVLAIVPLGGYLLGYFDRIESLSALPMP
jgi:hypothetical protein